MKKIMLLLGYCLVSVGSAFAQLEQYGPFVGGNAFVYKSNLFNASDLQADSVQKYKLTLGFSGGFDFGYRFENGVSVHSGISFGTSNQNYTGNDSIVGNVVEMTASSKLGFVKIPIMVSMQTRNEKPLKLFYSLGLYYGFNTGFSETYTFDYKYNDNIRDFTTTIKDKTVDTKYKNDTSIYNFELSDRPYKKHAWGAILGFGASKRMNDKLEGFAQLRIEYQISSVENTDEMVIIPNPGSKGESGVTRVWGNYAKYMHNAKSNYNRPATHPFNLGITFGLRYFLFDFE
jgi:hypothetical protein